MTNQSGILHILLPLTVALDQVAVRLTAASVRALLSPPTLLF